MKNLKWRCALVIIAAIVHAAPLDARDTDPLPNIVFILTDDKS